MARRPPQSVLPAHPQEAGGGDRKEKRRAAKSRIPAELQSWLRNCLIPTLVNEYLAERRLASDTELVRESLRRNDFGQVQRIIQ
jgi:hypothetical protein